MTRFLFFLFLSFICALLIEAAPPLQTNQEGFRNVPWFTEQALESPFLVDTSYADTTLTGFHRYDPFNWFIADKGNIGHAGYSMLFKPNLQSEFALNPAPLFPEYILDHQTIRFYRPNHVFTDLQYIIGANREQLFVAKHNQKLHETLFVGAKYQVVNSPGFYSRQAARNSYVRVHFEFLDAGKRYQALGSLAFNRISAQESGGLSDYQQFEQDPDQENVILSQATSRYRENVFTLNHFYQTGFYYSPGKDTLQERRFLNLGRLNHRFSYRRQSAVFQESTPPFDGFYEEPPTFFSRTRDSTQVHILENQLAWSNFPLQGENRTFPLNLRLFVTHRMVQVNQPALDTLRVTPEDSYSLVRDQFTQLVPGFELEGDQNRLISARGRGSMTFGGYNDGDVDLGGAIRIGASGKKHTLSVTAHYAEKEAPYFLSHFRGNYVSWDNDFFKSKWLQTGVVYSNPYLSLEANHYVVQDMVFMGPQAVPVQNQETVNVITAAIRSSLSLGAFRSTHHVVYQMADDDLFLNFPEWAGRHSLFFDFHMFRRSMGVQTGFDLSYHMAYPPMGYMPVVRQFYAQNDFPGRDTFVLDVFANFKISRTRLFVKMENIGNLITQTPPVYLIPFYPIPEAAFKFGVSWMFFD